MQINNNLNITGLTLKNFLSIGNATQAIKFDDHGMTLVLGHNSDANGGITRNGAGKALWVGSKILSPSGWIKMGDIKVGDIVTSADGGEAPVMGVYPQGELQLYNVKFGDGRSVECCIDHLWKVWGRFDSKWEWKIMTLGEIISHQENLRAPVNRIYVPLYNPSDSEDVPLPIDPRMLGLLIGDGCLEDKSIKYSTADAELVTYINEVSPDGYGLIKSGSSKYDYRLSAIDKTVSTYRKHNMHPVLQPLRNMKLSGCRSFEKFIPDVYKASSVQQKKALVQGLMDSDGYVGRNGELSYSTTSFKLASDVQEIIRSIGGIASIKNKASSYTYRGVKKHGRPSYNVIIRYPRPCELVGLERKCKRLSQAYQYENSLRSEIVSIEASRIAEAQCIAIDHPEHLFVTDDYIITHNTSILQALSFALYGQPLTKIKIDNLINNINGKGMHVVVDFNKDGKNYRIERGRKPNIMKFYINGEEVSENDAKGDNRETQVDINRMVGMSHTMFKHIVALNTYTEPFLKESAAKQREIIEELLGVTQISARAEKLKAIVSATKDTVKSLEAQHSATNAANLRIEKSIDRARDEAATWTERQEHTMAEIKDQLASTETIDFDAELKLLDAIDTHIADSQKLNTSLKLIQGEITQLERARSGIENDILRVERDMETSSDQAVARLQEEVSRNQNSIADGQKRITDVSEQISHFTVLLASPDDQNCKTCTQALTGTDHLDYVLRRFEEERDKNIASLAEWTSIVMLMEKTDIELRTEIKNVEEDFATKRAAAQIDQVRLTQELATTSVSLGDAYEKKEASENALVLLNGKPTSIFETRDEIYSLKYAKETLTTELARLVTENNPFLNQINSLQSAIQKINMDAINKETDALKHQEFLFKLLTSKDSFIRRKIIDQNLAFLNSRLNYYLTKLGLPHEVIFLSDLNVEIMLLGRDFDFDQLSRGESNRVIMATSWAFRDVWESLNNRVNVLWVDEMIDSGLDSNGAENALQILKGFARGGRNVFLVSHRDELIGRIDRTLYVSKENGFTSISEEEA